MAAQSNTEIAKRAFEIQKYVLPAFTACVLTETPWLRPRNGYKSESNDVISFALSPCTEW